MRNKKQRQKLVLDAARIYGRNVTDISRKTGVPTSTFYDWMKDHVFKEKYDTIMFELASEVRDDLLVKVFDHGNLNAQIALLKYDRMFNASEETVVDIEEQLKKARAKHGKRYIEPRNQGD